MELNRSVYNVLYFHMLWIIFNHIYSFTCVFDKLIQQNLLNSIYTLISIRLNEGERTVRGY